MTENSNRPNIRDKIYQLICLLVIAMLVSCHSSPSYEHSSKGDKEFYVDTKACETQAEEEYPDEGGIIGNAKKGDFVKKCLHEKGWIRKQV